MEWKKDADIVIAGEHNVAAIDIDYNYNRDCIFCNNYARTGLAGKYQAQMPLNEQSFETYR